MLSRLENEGYTVVSATGIRLDDKVNITPRPDYQHEGYINNEGQLESIGKHGMN